MTDRSRSRDRQDPKASEPSSGNHDDDDSKLFVGNVHFDVRFLCHFSATPFCCCVPGVGGSPAFRESGADDAIQNTSSIAFGDRTARVRRFAAEAIGRVGRLRISVTD